MNSIKYNIMKKYITKLVNIINTDDLKEINKHKRIINLAFLPDKVLFAYESTFSLTAQLTLSKKPFLFDIIDNDREALCAYKLHLSQSSDEILSFIEARVFKTLSPAEDRAIGCMLGMAIGDSLGAPFEFMPYRPGGVPVSTIGLDKPLKDSSNNPFRIKLGQWTDDTSMGLCLADSLLATNFQLDPLDLMLRFYAWWYLGYNNAFSLDDARGSKSSVGLGGSIGASLDMFKQKGMAFTDSGDKNTSGNGSIMRLAAVPILHHNDEIEAARIARIQSYTTHKGIEAAECAALMAIIIVRAINASGKPEERKNSVLDSLATYTCISCPAVQHLARSEAEPDGNIDRDWRWKRLPAGAHAFAPSRVKLNPGYVGSYAMDALAMSLHCIYATDTAVKAMLLAANMRGDSDTVAAITGQIAGAIYGSNTLPIDWVNLVELWHGYDGRIANLAHCLFHRKPALRDLQPVRVDSGTSGWFL